MEIFDEREEEVIRLRKEVADLKEENVSLKVQAKNISTMQELRKEIQFLCSEKDLLLKQLNTFKQSTLSTENNV